MWDEIDLTTQHLGATLSKKQKLERVLKHFVQHEGNYLIERTREIKSRFVQDVQELLQHVEDLKSISDFEKPATEDSLALGVSKRKVFQSRESELSRMLTSEDIKSLYHIFFSAFVIYGMSVIIHEFFEKGSFLEMEFLRWCFGNLQSTVWLWCILFVCSFLVLPLFRLWRYRSISTKLYILAYASLQLSFFAFTGPMVRYYDLPTASSLIVLCEQVRLSMKMHAFVRETYSMQRHGIWAHCDEDRVVNRAKAPQTTDSVEVSPLRKRGKARPDTPEKEHDAKERREVRSEPHVDSHGNDRLIDDSSEQFWQFFYFLFAPTLIYRNHYPRTPLIRWRFAIWRILETFSGILFTYVIFARFCVPYFARTPRDVSDLHEMIDSLFHATLPGTIVFLLVFFMVFHCWLNAWAELTRFADRQFYQDWWNATSFTAFSRKWNIVLYDWWYTYIWADFELYIKSKAAVLGINFLLTLAVQEFVISFTLNMFYPVLSVVLLCAFFLFTFSRSDSRLTGSQTWNVLMWFFLFIMNGLLMVSYSREWYARRSSSPGIDVDSWLPYSWQLIIARYQNT
eukprot:TRINITY_DN3453_c0_g1_i1.p1 TRINITY_DN3453_c0_g1~~TRINITY_DN3453_c0_g1_i1.p1  ORF type:complete len:593 (+),score=137.59 TRINITY_DN3453_c0_g1_i1:76-1779(+)